ncbi:hypothetical protein D3C84_268180 [compost metagenome]
MADGVGQQVGDRPLHHQPIAHDPAVAFDLQGDAFFVRRQGKQVGHSPRLGVQAEPFDQRRGGAGKDNVEVAVEDRQAAAFDETLGLAFSRGEGSTTGRYAEHGDGYPGPVQHWMLLSHGSCWSSCCR